MDLKLHFEPDPILHRICRPLFPKDFKTGFVTALAEQMAEAMEIWRGVGLAAPQVGHAIRLLVAKTDDGTILKLCNPSIIKQSEEVVAANEGCLSIPGKQFLVFRHQKIFFRYRNTDGSDGGCIAQDLFARILQHEMDHLDGRLISETGQLVKEDPCPDGVSKLLGASLASLPPS